MPIPNTWDKNESALTGIFPNALACNFKIAKDVTLIDKNASELAGDSAANTGIFIPFSDLTGIDNVGGNELGNSASPSANTADEDEGGARFMLGVLEAGYAAQQNAASANRLENCVMTRSALSVVDEDTLQKTFTVKFKLSHTSQDVEAE